MIRVVLDTNVVVSAALSKSGPPFRIIELANRRSIKLWISPATFVEYDEVLSRPRIGVPPGRAKALLLELKKGRRIHNAFEKGLQIAGSRRRYVPGMRRGSECSLPCDRQHQPFSRTLEVLEDSHTEAVP